MSTITDLIKGVSEPEYYSDLIAKHKANGVPVDAWLSTNNFGLALTKEMSQLLASLRGSAKTPEEFIGVSYVVASMFLQYAFGDGLTLFAKSQYQTERMPASATQGIMRLVSAPAAPVYNISVGQLTVGSTSNPALTYINVTGGTLPSGGTLDLVFRATGTGVKFNIQNSQPVVLKTSLAGVTVNNPIYPPSVTWITSVGTEEESDISLKKRCLARWGTVGAECNEEALKWFALLPPPGYTSSPVKYTRVMRNFTITPSVTGHWPGIVSVVLGNDAGALTPSDKAAVISNFESPKKYGIGREINYIDMSFLSITINAIVYIYKESGADPLDIKRKVEASLTDFQLFLQIGEIVTVQKIGARMEDADKISIKEVRVTSPSATIIPGYTEKVIFSIGTISYLSV